MPQRGAMGHWKDGKANKMELSEVGRNHTLKPFPGPEKTTIPAIQVALRNIQIPPSAHPFL
jgi:hypothetical protein